MLHFHIFLVSYLPVVFQIEALSSNTSCVVHYHIVAKLQLLWCSSSGHWQFLCCMTLLVHGVDGPWLIAQKMDIWLFNLQSLIYPAS